MKKWLLVIGWTMLAMGTYYVIEVLFSAVFRYLMKTAGTGEQLAFYTMIANWVVKTVMIFVFGFWYRVREYKWNYRPDYKGAFSAKNTACLLGIGLFGQYALSTIVTFVRVIAPEFFHEFNKVSRALELNRGTPLLTLGLVVVIGPVAEELLFRGVIYGKLRETFTVTQAAVISGGIFGIYHKNIVQGLYAALFGVMLAYLFEKTQTIWGAIVMHMMFNLSSYLLSFLKMLAVRYGLSGSMTVVGILILDIVSVVIVTGCLILLRKRGNRYDEIEQLKMNSFVKNAD